MGGGQIGLASIAAVAAICAGVYYGNVGDIKVLIDSLLEPAELKWFREGKERGSSLIFTTDRLRFFNGRVKGRPMVLCVVGHCFDVTGGETFYFGADQPYNCFIGRDGTRAFVTGEFTAQGAIDDVSDFEGGQWGGVGHWLDFYKGHAKYQQVGVLVGPYFTEAGEGTDVLSKVLRSIEDRRKAEEDDKRSFPPCNSKYTPEEGTVFWCTRESGGVERNWAGHPRKRDVGQGGLCVCISGERLAASALDPTITEFEGCDMEAERCKMG